MLRLLAFAGLSFAILPQDERVLNLPEVGDISKMNW
jgi:hypothetical protein